MKKILGLCLALLLSVGLVACEKDKEEEVVVEAAPVVEDVVEAVVEEEIVEEEPVVEEEIIEEEPVCEHQWVEATYTDPAYCELCGEIDGEPLQPYFVQEGLPISEDMEDHSIVGVLYANEDITQYRFCQFDCSFGEVTAVPAEEEGYQVVSFDVVCGTTLVYEESTKLNFTFSAFYNSLYDYYTGMSYGGQSLVEENNNYNVAMQVEVDGEIYDVSYTKENTWAEGGWVQVDGGYTNAMVCTQHYEFLIPIGYDGIVYSGDEAEYQTEEELYDDEMQEGGELVTMEANPQFFRIISPEV